MKKTFLVFSILILSAFAQSAYAETVLRISDSVSLATDQIVNGDFYSAAESISLSGAIDGDVHAVAGTATLNGSVTQDVFVVGGSAQLYASVTDDVRIVAGDVTVADYVGGDLFVLAGKLTVLSSARVEGNVFFYGGTGEINGSIGGSLYGTSETLRIDGPIGGNVQIKSINTLVLGDRTDIAGDVQYESNNELVRAQNAVVVGRVLKNDAKHIPADPQNALVPFLVYAFSVLIMFAIFHNHLHTLMQEASTNFTRYGLIGIASMIFAPFAIVLSFVTVIGLFIGLTALFALAAVYVFTFLLVSIFVGVLLNNTFGKSSSVTLLWTLLGILSTQILLAIPLVGPLVVFALFLVLLGAVLTKVYKTFA